MLDASTHLKEPMRDESSPPSGRFFRILFDRRTAEEAVRLLNGPPATMPSAVACCGTAEADVPCTEETSSQRGGDLARRVAA